MKKILCLFTAALLLASGIKAQAPQLLNFQGVARNPVGNVIVNKAISVRLTVHDNSAAGPVVYSETRAVTTNAFGLFNIVIGSAGATATTGSVATVNWGTNTKFLQLEVDPAGGTTFTAVGTTQLVSAPYALFAASANPSGAAGGDLTGTYPNPSLANTAVTAGNYGNASNFTTFSVDSKGRLTAAATFPLPASLPPNGAAGGDLAGTYPNPSLANTAVTAGSYGNATNYPTFTVDGKGRLTAASSLPFPATLPPSGAAGGDLTGTYPNPTILFPLIKTSSQAANPLIGMTNSSATGTLGAIQASSASQDANAVALQGTISSTTPGGFSSALRGVNNSTTGLGIGVYGSQAGGGWGVYGVTPTGLGVYGNATGAGYGVYGNSNTGIGVNGTSTTGNAGNFSITNNANTSAALTASTNGDGSAVDAATSSASASISAIKGTVSATAPGGFSAGVRGINNGTSGLGIGVWGSQAGSGWGVYGVTPTGLGVYGNATGAGTGVFAASNTGIGLSASSTTGTAASINITNSTNTSNTLELSNSGTGAGVNLSLPNGSSGGKGINIAVAGFGHGVYATSASGTGLEGITSSISSAGVIGRNATGEAIVGFSSGVSGVGAVVGRSDGAGYGVRGFNTQNGIGVMGQSGISGGTGVAGHFENVNSANSSNTLEVATNGTGAGVNVSLPNASSGGRGINIAVAGFGHGVYATSASGTGLEGITSSISSAGVIGRNATGEAIVGFSSGVSGVGAVVGRSDGAGYGVRGFNTQNGIGVIGQSGISGGTGNAAVFQNVNSANSTDVFVVSSNSTANLAVFKTSGNVARIDANGKGFFNGGTQASGADVAEAFDVTGSTAAYEPGDVLSISTTKDRTVEKSSSAYSTLVVGVYATKPGVLLTEEGIDSKMEGKVPMGVIGVIPTKVCTEGGAIKTGDMLVTSSIPGVAMKADPEKVKIGQVIGKALQDYNAAGTGKINVLVSVK